MWYRIIRYLQLDILITIVRMCVKKHKVYENLYAKCKFQRMY